MSSSPSPTRSHVVIVGGGFGGLYAAKALGKKVISVTVVERRNFHLFQPLLYQVATGGLSPGDISSPLRSVLKRHRKTRIVASEVVDVRPEDNVLVLGSGNEVSYDYLVIATGMVYNYFGHDDWVGKAPSLKTVEDALEIRKRIFAAFESAEREEDADKRKAWMRFVIIGGGPTGVEMAGAIAELKQTTLRDEFRQIDSRDAEVILIEASDRMLPAYPPGLSARAVRSLERLGATVLTDTRVEDIDEGGGVTISRPGKDEERIEARTVVWAAGTKATPFADRLAQQTGTEQDRAGTRASWNKPFLQGYQTR